MEFKPTPFQLALLIPNMFQIELLAMEYALH